VPDASALDPTVPRHRYRQNPLPLGSEAPEPLVYGPEQELPPGLQLIEQGQLEVIPLGPLFEDNDAIETQASTT
jgi:hypothetical protein